MTTLNSEFRAAREAGEEHEGALAGAYLTTIRKSGRTAAARFEHRAVLVAAANWHPPEISDVMAYAVDGDRIRNAQRRTSAAINDRLAEITGVSFDALMPPTAKQLTKLGLRAVNLAGDIRQPVADAIAQGWAEGRSVTQTAALILEKVYGLAPERAVMLARTDLISLSNGANQNAIQTLNAAAKEAGEPPAVQSKTWLATGDGRTRETHADADGQTVPIDQPYDVGGEELQYPGDPEGSDAEVINCRCTELYSDEAATSADTGEIPDEAPVPDLAASVVWNPGLPFMQATEEDDVKAGTATIEIIPDFTEWDRRVAERTAILAEAAAPEAPAATAWVSDVAFENVPTGDGRFMVTDSLGWRDLPLTLMAMIETPEMGGHAGAQVAGRMDDFTKDGKADMAGAALKDGAVAVRSTGMFDTGGEYGAEIARMVGDETLRGISIDLSVSEWAFRDPETGDLIDPEEATDDDWEKAFMGAYDFAVVKGEIMAATICPTPAFADARIAILAAGYVRPNVWKASAQAAEEFGIAEGTLCTTLTASIQPVEDHDVVANPLWEWAAGRREFTKHPARPKQAAAPSALPAAWLHRSEPDGPCPMRYEDNGEVYGHIALWDTCHTGFLHGEYSQCIRAPKSMHDYAHFHHGEHLTAEGDLVEIGKLTYATGHADLSKSRVAARDHYDNTGAVGAFVRAINGRHGIFISGGLRASVDPAAVIDMRACPPSGDWRSFERNLELIAALSVPVPGFPVARSQLALSAAANGEIEVTALILTGLTAGGWRPNVTPEHEGMALAALIDGEDALDALIQG